MADYLDNVMMNPLFQMGIAGLSGRGQASGLKQAQDYRLVNAQKQQQEVADQTQKALSQIDLNDPEALMTAANSLMKINAPAGIKLFQAAQAAKAQQAQNAINAQMKMIQMQKYQSDIRKNDATTESLVNPLGALSGGNTGTGEAMDAAGLPTGEDFIKTLPHQTAGIVRALSEGRMALPAGFALKSPYWQQMIAATQQYDPSFDLANAPTRVATRKDFTSGKSAQNITALNTAMQHAAKLNDAFDALDNGDFQTYNTITNWLGEVTGNKKIQGDIASVKGATNALAGELAKVFRSTGMSTKEIDDWKESLPTNATPAQVKGFIATAMELMNGRLQALGQQYNQGMNSTKEPIELLSPEAQKSYNKLSGMTYDSSKPATYTLADLLAEKARRQKGK